MIDWQPQFNSPDICPSCVYAAPVLVILYENPSLETINIEILINNQANDNHMILTSNNFNPANFNKDIGMGIHSDRLAGNPTDGYIFNINNSLIGILNTSDNPTIGSPNGVIGNYYYQNEVLTGLNDDTADDLFRLFYTM